MTDTAKCCSCLTEIPLPEYLAGDFYCDLCAAIEAGRGR